MNQESYDLIEKVYNNPPPFISDNDLFHFHIENYPQDIYSAVGEIIAVAQDWETAYKNFARLCKHKKKCHIKTKDISNASLNRLNRILYQDKHIDEQVFKNLELIIDIRNYVNHELFLTDFKIQGDFKAQLRYLEKILNAAYILICEATDIVNNGIDILNNNMYALRPTVFLKL